ncbi:hypothetical protein HF086_008001 [Spodoptera exigua]|uniref:Uncharacterized protein n=1 Tax=Spodoptera exigua TaxID=7107 RepID=A0A922S9I5_SPOEX|nr:hypothetical protein HF086_008001 [Spodoptera exigua]
MSTKTMSYFRNLIIVENFFCVSRPYLIKDHRTRLICNYISIGMIIIITCFIITDIISIDLGVGNRIFEVVIGFEFFSLAIGSRYQQTVFRAIDRLDEKCGVDEDYGSKIRVKTVELVFIFLTSVVIDFVGLLMLGTNKTFAVFLCVAFAAHDAEMAFASLLVEAVNLRLKKLKDVVPNTGSRIYRHVLITTAHISEQCTSTSHKSDDNGCMCPLSERNAKLKLKIRSIFAQVVMAYDHFNNAKLTWN